MKYKLKKPTIVLVSGKMRSGKDTFSDILVDELKLFNIKTTKTFFSKILKDDCKSDFEQYVTVHNNYLRTLYKQFTYLKNKIPLANMLYYDFNDIENIIKDGIISEDNFYENKNQFTRSLLQLYGTEIFRDRVDKNHWINKTFEVIDKSFKDGSNEIVVISDTRFPNEITKIKEYCKDKYDVITIRIVRDLERSKIADEHESEKALDSFNDFDLVVFNNSTLMDLESRIQTIAINNILTKDEEINEPTFFQKIRGKIFKRK